MITTNIGPGIIRNIVATVIVVSGVNVLGPKANGCPVTDSSNRDSTFSNNNEEQLNSKQSISSIISLSYNTNVDNSGTTIEVVKQQPGWQQKSRSKSNTDDKNNHNNYTNYYTCQSDPSSDNNNNKYMIQLDPSKKEIPEVYMQWCRCP